MAQTITQTELMLDRHLLNARVADEELKSLSDYPISYQLMYELVSLDSRLAWRFVFDAVCLYIKSVDDISPVLLFYVKENRISYSIHNSKMYLNDPNSLPVLLDLVRSALNRPIIKDCDSDP